MNAAADRRAVLPAVLSAGAAGATAVLPAAASSGPQLSAIDRKVIDLWQRRQQMIAASEDECFDPSEAEEEVWGEEFCDVIRQIDKQIGASVLALGAVLMGAIRDRAPEQVSGLHRACLAAIRPQLVGVIAEAADRVLAEHEEALT